MATPVRSILKAVSNNIDTLDVVSFSNYPYYDWMISLASHNFHIYKGDRLPCSWDENVLAKPNNVSFDVDPDLPISLDANLVLCHSRLEQFDVAQIFSNFWHLPVCLVHQLGPRDMKYHSQWPNMKRRRGHSNIFLSSRIQEEWDIPGFIIPPGIPEIRSNENKQKENISHIWCGEKERQFITKNIGAVGFIKNGDFRSSMILVNTITQFYPVHLLVAMAHGCCVLTPKIPEFEDLIEHEVSGLIYKDVPDLNNILNTYRNRRSKCSDIGQEAQSRVRERFPLSKFTTRLNIALKQSAEIMYTR